VKFIWLDKNMTKKELEEEENEILINERKEDDDQLFVLVFWLSDLNVEA
jgi:hypothetical protein